ncbi:hypothetical protein ASD04_07030 [Devosia sp. Root436]|uniref:hypothetical protein n=1 Tax=Devosia sp. Root436 TaxID=1736537 RepID=UPI0006F3F531|nr:hypothetical protein [Devosia sp. Root436]KQX40376.1 hypothetical protein ASD04_07030 [Devosia sp. Root436]
MNWRVYATQTSDVVLKLFREDQELLADAAGAVLAMHQDTHLGFGIDMHRTDDAVWNAAMDKMQPNRMGKFPDRVMIVMKMLPDIDNAWLDFIQNERPADISDSRWQALSLMARFRSNAARTWLMTIMSKQDTDTGGEMRMSVETIWMALATVPRAVAVERAAEYVGTFYDGVKNEGINPKAWPQIE